MTETLVTPACYYASWGAYALGWTHFVPNVATLVFVVLGLLYSEFFFLLVGFYFKGAVFLLQVAQMHVGALRPDPYCAVYHTYAFPSVETFYCVALLTFLVVYVFTDQRESQVSLYGWILALLLGVAPVILVAYKYNTWQEVVSTVVIAIVPTTLFMLFLRFVIHPNVAYLMPSPPFSWFGYQSHLLPAPEAREVDMALWAKAWREQE